MHDVFISATILAAVVAFATGAGALVRARAPGARSLAITLLAAGFWCATYAGELMAATEASKDVWARLQYFGIVLVGPGWLLFALRYTGKVRTGAWGVRFLLLALPVATLVMALGGVGIGLVWSDAHMVSIDGFNIYQVEHGPWFWLHIAYTYGCLLIGAVLLMTSVFAEVRALTARTGLVVLAMALPWLANALSLLIVRPHTGLDLTPPSLAMGALLGGVSLRNFHALEVFPGIVPVARDIVVQRMRDGVLVVGPENTVISANRAAERLLGVEAGALVGTDAHKYLPGIAEASHRQDTGAPPLRECSFESIVGPAHNRRHVEVYVSPLASDTAAGVVMSMRDVTERRQLQEELEHRALHDDLTGLPNRALLRAQLRELLALQRRSGGQVALLMLDLDRFKEINDTFGHTTGNVVLQTVAERLRGAVRESDLVVRLGGDEFAVVLTGATADGALEVARSLRDSLLTPMTVHLHRFGIGASVGIAIGGEHGRDVDVLLQRADVALYLAKERSQGVALYEPSLDPNSPELLEFIHEVRSAVETGRVIMHYQPVVSCHDGAIRRVESLAHLQRDDGTLITAAAFMPFVTHTGLLEKLTSIALKQALGTCRRWDAEGWRTVVAVNLSTEDLYDLELVTRITDALAEEALDPDRLVLEIAETSIMTNPERAQHVLKSLCDSGVHVSIDDFGVGRSSLAYLRTLPAAELKIDSSFARGITHIKANQAIVRASVALGHDLGLTVIAEGVERQEDLEMLRELGCDCVQGYATGRPMPADELLTWSRAHGGATAR